jgi:phosphoglycolate phosphatase-like HAD superfamily hydrolase
LGKEPERAKMFARYRECPHGLWDRTGTIRAFVFDLDGTLVETEELKALSYARAAAELRPDLDEREVMEAFKDLVGLSRQEVAIGLMLDRSHVVDDPRTLTTVVRHLISVHRQPLSG